MQEVEKVVISEQEFRRRFVYDHSNLLGEGGFAKVYKAYDRQFDETVALKFYTNTDAKKYDIITEMRNSRQFTHKNIIRVYDARIVRFTSSFGLTEDVQVGILEYANAGNLHDFLNTTPSEEEFKEVMKGILHGLHYLHTEKRVIHRDLSPDNILMVKEQEVWIPKIADFGISKQVDLKTVHMGSKKASSELVGKMEYMAPEQFDPQKYGISQKITTNVDLWSFGIILTEVFTEETPFGDRKSAQSPMQVMHNVLHNPLPPQIDDIPEPYRGIIKSCLVKDAKRRVQSSLELINMLAVPVQKKKKSNTAGIVMAVVLLLLLGFGAWYVLIFLNENPDPDKKEASIVTDDKSDPVVPQPSDSTLAEADSTRTHENNNSILEEPSEEEEKQNEPSPSKDVSKPLPVTPDYARLQRVQLFKSLLREIKSMDNEEAYLSLRISRIDRCINELFVNNQARVWVRANDSIQEQNVEEFFNYVISTAGTEQRDWRIDTLQTQLSGNKIAALHLRKY